MKMNQNERRFDFHGLGAALKRAREEKGWTQAYVAELVDRDSRTIMNIENKGQYSARLRPYCSAVRKPCCTLATSIFHPIVPGRGTELFKIV